MSAQIGRIARLLDVDRSEVQGLDEVPNEDLRVLHDQISTLLFADSQRRFARIAGLSKTIPGPVAGVLAEKFLPPVMAARVSEMLDPAKARDLIGRVSIPYLCEIALALDPVRSRPVVQQLPAEPIGKVAKALFARKEYATMAEFVGTVTVDALFAAFEVATPHDLLTVVPMLEWNDSLDVVVAGLPHHKVTQIAQALSAVELADLAMALDPSRMGPIVAAVPVGTVVGIAESLFERGEYAGMARFVGVVTPEMVHAVLTGLPVEHVRPMVAELSATELADLALVLDPAALAPIAEHVPAETVGEIARVLFERAEYAGMARFVGVVTPEMLHAAFDVATPHDLLGVVPLLDWNENLDAVIAQLPAGQVEAIAAELDAGEMADLALGLDPSRMGPILRVVPTSTVAEVARVLFARKQVTAMVKFVDVIDDVPDEVVDALLAEIADGEDWESAKQAFEEIAPEPQERLFARFDRLAPDHQQRFLAAADAGELGPAATKLLATRRN